MTPEDRIKDLRSDAPPTEAEWLEFRSTAHKSLARRRMAAVAGGLGLVAALVGGGYAMTNMDTGDERGPGIANTPTEEPSPTSSPSSEETVAPEKETVYLQQWYIEADDTLLVTHAPFESSDTPARDAMEALIAGVPGPLAETGVSTAIPPGTRLLDLTIDNGTAHVAFESPHHEQYVANAQVVYTLTQFPTVQKVEISWRPGNGGPAEKRSDYEDLLPAIVVQSPFDGEIVERTFTMSGLANVFEATVSYRLVDADGITIQEGFTTATCGTGCYGAFEEKITYKGEQNYAILQVFESSAEDGSPLHMQEIPLNFE